MRVEWVILLIFNIDLRYCMNYEYRNYPKRNFTMRLLSIEDDSDMFTHYCKKTMILVKQKCDFINKS